MRNEINTFNKQGLPYERARRITPSLTQEMEWNLILLSLKEIRDT